jgi:predicted CXXCH cytochrome family protein
MILFISAVLVVGAGLTLAESPAPLPRYVGSEACSGCHTPIADEWIKSHHALAWTPPDKSTVLGDFSGAALEHKGVVSRFFKRNETFVIETDGPDGKLKEYEVKSVAGIAPLQQYLLETEPGRLQASDLAWDTVKKRWYHLYPEQELKAGDGLHWTGPYKTWNARCAECHATGYRRNYDPQSRRYSSTQAEIGVGCEACHGPGEAHVGWAKNPGNYDSNRWGGLTKKGLTVGFTAQSAETEIQQCAGCHSRREPLSDGNPIPGTAYHDAYGLALLRDRLYNADGSIQDEVYVYGSFLQSKMHARRVRCSDCHDPHAAKLKADGNAVCTQCHWPAGNPRFPTLRKAAYGTPSHHFHTQGSDGAQCKSCHMIERVYMGIDGRRDHSFRIPRPDLAKETGAPNACTDCHKDRDASWAASEIARRFPDSSRRGPHFSQVFAKARKEPASAADALLKIANDKTVAGITRATALDLLRSVATPSIAERAAPLISDVDPLVRAAVVTLQRGAPALERVQRLVPALEDNVQSVRIAAARGLLGAPIARLPTRTATAFQKANAEWRASLLARSDFPETHMVLGGVALVLRNAPAAAKAFGEAVRQDPQLVQAWIMLVRIAAAQGDRKTAREAVESGLSANPKEPVLLSLREQLDNMTGR